MLTVNLTAYSRQNATGLIQKIEEIILKNGCYVTDYSSFGPTEMSVTFEGECSFIQKTVADLRSLDITLTDYAEYEISRIQRMTGDLIVVLYLYTGKKKDLKDFLDERFK